MNGDGGCVRYKTKSAGWYGLRVGYMTMCC